MDRDDLLLLSAHYSSLLDTADQSLSCHLEIVGINDQLIMPRGQQSSLVAEIGNISAAEAWSQRGQALRIHIFAFGLFEADLAEMNVENLPSSLEIGKVNLHYSIEPARSNERRVKQILPVGCGHNNNVAISAKSIHFHQDLIESVVSLVM